MKKYSKFFAVLLTLVILLSGTMGRSLAAEGDIVVRLAGKGRVETSIEASKAAYPGGASNVILAGYNGEVDALTGTLLAGSKAGPLMLTNPKLVPDILLGELRRLGAKNIFILGGPLVVSEKVVSQLEGLNYKVKRIAGSDRDATAAAVAKEVKGSSAQHVFLAQGHSEILADALVLGPASVKENSPVLLTRTNEIPAISLTTMDALGVNHVTIVGGTNAVSSAVESQLKARYTRVDRLEGKNREETAVLVAEKYFANSRLALVANGYVYPDALVGGYLGAKKDSPILLSNLNTIKAETTDYITRNVDKAWILGGKAVVSEVVEDILKNTIDDTIPPKVIRVENGVNSVTVRFSEPLETIERVTINGRAWEYTFTADKTAIRVASLKAGESYELSISGARDRSGNYISPNPTILNLDIKAW